MKQFFSFPLVGLRSFYIHELNGWELEPSLVTGQCGSHSFSETSPFGQNPLFPPSALQHHPQPGWETQGRSPGAALGKVANCLVFLFFLYDFTCFVCLFARTGERKPVQFPGGCHDSERDRAALGLVHGRNARE